MAITSPFAWNSNAVSHVGRVRGHNEDCWLEQPEIGLWAVADGMGGHAAGDFASRMIVEYLAGVGANGRLSTLVSDVESAILDANHELVEYASRTQQTVGSTIVTLLLHGRHCVCMWAGDSRAYRLRDGTLKQLTTDHSEVERYVQLGLLAREDAAHHPAAHMLTRAVGVEEPLHIDIDIGEIATGDRFLLCSDGLDRHVADAEIEQVLGRGSPAEVVAMLIAMTLDRGANDNVTVTVVEIAPANRD